MLFEKLRLARLQLLYDGPPVVLPGSKDGMITFFRERGLSTAPQESGWVMAIDTGLRVNTLIEVAKGGSNKLPIHMPTLLSAVLTSGTDRFFFVHNHPGGHLRPSEADFRVTKMISDAAALVGLYFEDHMIITRDGLYSMRAKGDYIPPDYKDVEAAKYGSP